MRKTSGWMALKIAGVMLALIQAAPADEVEPQNECFEVVGTASMQGVSEGFAKKMAIRDALKSASMRRGLQVRSQTTMKQMQITEDRTHFQTESKVQSFTVLQAGLESSEDMYGVAKPAPLNYEVRLQVCLGDAEGQCGHGGKAYQARLLVAPLVVEDTASVSDIRSLVQGYSFALADTLKEFGYRNLALSQNTHIPVSDRATGPNLDRDFLNEVYERSGAQYALLSILRSASVRNTDSQTWNQVKRMYNFSIEANQRFLKLDTYIVDLLQGRVEHRFEKSIELNGQVRVGREHPFGSAAFWRTQTGGGFRTLLQTSAEDTVKALQCKPFQASIADIRGREYFIYLNQASGVEVGDELAVYHKLDRPVSYAGTSLGSDMQPGAFLKVTRIMPEFAVAEISESADKIVSIGDRVMPW
ncbi:flagellar assembly protein T N-terminal domain-containing protein [Thiomicrorhabdus sp.]|uniref:flagellar assembly protein T N-terminal domain-containing protein n=1 Tax=Thiomicrorhabdus sp. TaxID=2039724 RepID=UPI0029C62D46|nr:flagellar assembly protein T N-terminal domain-containing protein [Thiomicrorhabdus sp.]